MLQFFPIHEVIFRLNKTERKFSISSMRSHHMFSIRGVFMQVDQPNCKLSSSRLSSDFKIKQTKKNKPFLTITLEDLTHKFSFNIFDDINRNLEFIKNNNAIYIQGGFDDYGFKVKSLSLLENYHPKIKNIRIILDLMKIDVSLIELLKKQLVVLENTSINVDFKNNIDKRINNSTKIYTFVYELQINDNKNSIVMRNVKNAMDITQSLISELGNDNISIIFQQY